MNPRWPIALCLLACACGAEDADGDKKVLGLWFACLDDDCDSLDDDGFELQEGGGFVSVRRASAPDEDLVYCQAAFGHFTRDGSELHITPQDAFADELPERTVRFTVKGNRGALRDEGQTERAYARVEGKDDGLCPGVHTDL